MILLYIDPGTGSMLFSIVIGIVATLYFTLRTFGLKLKVLLSSKKGLKEAAKQSSCVIYNEGKQYVPLFYPIVQEFSSRKQPLSYLTSDENDPVLSQAQEGKMPFVKAEFIGKGNKAFARLNLLEADIMLMTTPGLDVYQLKRSKKVKHYSHIPHAVSELTGYRPFGLDFYDSVLCTGDYQKDDMIYLEDLRKIKKKEYVTVGCPYLDFYHDQISDLPKRTDSTFTVLVAPSWGPAALLAVAGKQILGNLLDAGIKVILRPHPQSWTAEKDLLDSLKNDFKDYSNLEWDSSPSNLLSLSKADMMISDFSGVVFDYTFLFDKPVFYTNAECDERYYDAFDIPHKRWSLENLEKFGIKIDVSNLRNIAKLVKQASTDKNLEKARNQALQEGWMHQGEAAKRVVDFMVSKCSSEKKENSK